MNNAPYGRLYLSQKHNTMKCSFLPPSKTERFVQARLSDLKALPTRRGAR